MSIWTPEWRITIDGYTITDVTLANLTITSGRTDIFQQASAGYAQLSLINVSNEVYGWGINYQLTIEVKDSSGTFIPIFGGWVTDINIGVQNAGSASVVTNATVMAVGALAKIQKVVTDGILSKDFEGNQILSLLEGYLLGTWNNVSASQTWAAYDPTTTWANAENLGIGEIDTPGDYEMTARSSSATNLYDLVAQIATSAFGYIYEDANGNIGYADTTHRQTYLATNGYTTLPGGAAGWNGIATTQRIGDIRNRLILNYGNNYSSSLTDEDLDSQALYGVYAEQVNWNVFGASDAADLADRYLQLRSTPYQRFQSISFDLGNPEIDDTDRDALLNIFMGLPVEIDGLPANIATAGTFQGFVEGWSFRASYNGLNLTFNASPLDFNEPTLRWENAGVATKWSDVLATIDWTEATGVLT